MESSIVLFCSICQEELTHDKVSYSCNHAFCFKCCPYLLFKLLKTFGLNWKFFERPEKEYPCPICSKVFSKFPFEQVFEDFKSTSEIFQENEIPDNKAENPAMYLSSFRDSSFNEPTTEKKMHKKTLSIPNFEEKNSEIVKFQCSCPEKHALTHFCFKCKTAICHPLLKSLHSNHIPNVSLQDFNLLKTNSEALNYKVGTLLENFMKFNESFINKIEASRKSLITQFDNMIDEIICELKSMKSFNLEKINRETDFLRTQTKIIQSSLAFIQKELSQNFSNLHPNKQFQLVRLLEDIKSDKYEVKEGDWKIKYDEMLGNFEYIKKNISNVKQTVFSEENRIMKFGDSEFFKIEKQEPDRLNEIFQNFKTNPTDMLKQPEFSIIDVGSFYGNWYKSNLSCGFMIKEESFIAWAGYSKDESGILRYPLIVYNISQMKKELIFQKDSKFSKITQVSTYPQDDINYFNKKWLYTADSAGVLRIYEISAEKSFKLLSEINTKIEKEKAILSAKIFHDKFKELDSKSFKNNEKDEITHCYVMIVLNDPLLPILLYRRVNESIFSNGLKWELFRKIANPLKKHCYTINFHYDEALSKTRFYFGFSQKFIAIYDLKTNKWETTDFETKDRVNSIEFFFRKRMMTVASFTSLYSVENQTEGFVIYSQYNRTLVIGNLETRQIVRKIEFPHVCKILDCYVWNSPHDNYIGETYLVMVTREKNSIQIIDFDSLNVLFIKKFEQYPINLVKVLKKDQENYRESVACFFEDGDASKIVVFEKK